MFRRFRVARTHLKVPSCLLGFKLEAGFESTSVAIAAALLFRVYALGLRL